MKKYHTAQVSQLSLSIVSNRIRGFGKLIHFSDFELIFYPTSKFKVKKISLPDKLAVQHRVAGTKIKPHSGGVVKTDINTAMAIGRYQLLFDK